MTAPAPGPRASALPYILSFVAGFVTCLAIVKIAGRREMWDSTLYFVAGIPLMCVVAFAVAYAFPVRVWRWVVAMAIGQSLVLLMGGGALSLWPLSIVALTVLSLPQFVAAFVAAKLARRRKAPSP
jgi:uncharacterized membrane protein YcaP (DUF421 family)